MFTTRRSLSLFAVAVVATACGSASPPAQAGTPRGTPAASGNATATPTVSASPSPSPSLDVAPLIPELAADGTLNLLDEDGNVTASFPATTSLQLLSPFGDGFLVLQGSGTSTALVSLHANGTLEPLQQNANALYGEETGALDGHAWAWLQGTQYSSICNPGLSSGQLMVQSPGTAPRVIAQLPAGSSGAAWQLAGWAGDDIWVVQTAGCSGAGSVTTTAYVAHENGTTLTSMQQQLGAGCLLTSVALDGSMLCAAQLTKPSVATWRFVGANGTVRDFSAASLGAVCHGHGTLYDLNPTMSLDARYIAVDAGCAGPARFDRISIITTATGGVQLVNSPTYLAADTWLPDDRLLCNDLSNPSRPTAYLVTPGGGVSVLANGDATWSGGVSW